MEPTHPTLGDKVKAAVKGVVPPAMGGTAGTGIPTGLTAEEEALKRQERHEARAAGVGGGGLGGAGMGAGAGAGGLGAREGMMMGAEGGGIGTEAGYGGGAGTTTTTMGTTGGVGGRGGGLVGGIERGAERVEAGFERGVAAAERVIHRATGQVVEDRPVVKEVRQEFVEHRPVAVQTETVTRVIGEKGVEGGTRLEPVGPAQERIVREGVAGETTMAGARGVGTTAGMTEEERLEAERLGGGGRGTI
jgi:hypothetical protein